MKLEWRDYFTDTKGQPSMTRLLMFLSFPVASWAVISNPGSETLWPYLGAFAGAYAGGKFADALSNAAGNVTVNNADTVNVKKDTDESDGA